MVFVCAFLPVGSAAGLLMTSNDEIVFDDRANPSISHSLHANTSADSPRKRHKSAGNEQAKSQQAETINVWNSCQQDSGSLSNQTTKSVPKTLFLKETDNNRNCVVDSVSVGAGGKPCETFSDPIVCNSETEGERNVNNHTWMDPLSSVSETDTSTASTSAVVVNSVGETNNKGDLSAVSAATSTSSLSSTSSANHAKTSPASPSHSLRTPVTENDPLGLFTIYNSTPAPTDSASTTLTFSQNHSNTDLLLNLTSPVASNLNSHIADSRGSSQTTTPTPTSAASSSSRRNLFIDMEPFSGLLTRTRDSPARRKAATLPAKLSNGSDPREPRVSADSSPSDCSSPEAWSPLSESASAQKLSGAALDKSQEDIADSGSLSGSTGNMKTSTPVRRLVARSESFHNVLKSAATVFATKFSEIKQQVSTISTPSKTGSNQSLQKSIESERLLSEEDEDLLNSRGQILTHSQVR